MSCCEHRDVVPIFTQSAVCVDCGEAVCAQCRVKDCKAFFWNVIVAEGKWHGRALSREDACNALNSATLLCRFRAGKALWQQS